jgi:hypothetical protein
MQFALEAVVLECFFLNHSQGILGVNLEMPQEPKIGVWMT